MKPLTIRRMSLRRNGKNPKLPWVFRCGCGLKSQIQTFEYGLYKIRTHDCEDFHP